MAYLPLTNYNYDSGPHRIQSGPNHEGYIVLNSGVQSYGADNGIIVDGTPLSGVIGAMQTWAYDANWRYVPLTYATPSGAVNPTFYPTSGVLGAYTGSAGYTHITAAGAQIASLVSPAATALTPRGAALQAGASVTRPETYIYFDGYAPDNQAYDPYTTPEFNSAAEGYTGGGVTHRSHESTILTNVLGSQGTSDRSEWTYNKPVYCKTYTAVERSTEPGLMSVPLRSIYRGFSTSYNYSYGSYLLSNLGGFKGDEPPGCPFAVSCPLTDGYTTFLTPGDTLIAAPPCNYVNIKWYNTLSSDSVGEGTEYILQNSDISGYMYFTVLYPNRDVDSSSTECFPVVSLTLGLRLFQVWARNWSGSFANEFPAAYAPAIDAFGAFYVQHWWAGGSAGGFTYPFPYKPVISKVTSSGDLAWSYDYLISDSYTQTDYYSSAHCLVDGRLYSFSVLKSPLDNASIKLVRLVINPTTGNVEKVDGILFNIVNAPSSVQSYLGVSEVQTDYNGNFWLAVEVPEYFLVRNVYTTNTGIILKLTEFEDGSLASDWNYELLSKNIVNPLERYYGSSLQAFSLDLERNRVSVDSGSFTSFSSSTPIFLDATNGDLLYKQPFYTLDGDPNILKYICTYLSPDGSIYQAATTGIDRDIDITDTFWVSKKTDYTTVVWMKRVIPANSGFSVVSTKCLVEVDTKLVVIVGRRVATSPAYYFHPRLYLLNAETGDVLRVIQITLHSTGKNGGGDMRVKSSNNPEEFTIFTSNGFYINLNVNNIPLNTTVTCRSTDQTYTFTDFTPSGVIDYTILSPSILEIPPDRRWETSEAYFVLPTASGIPTTPYSATILSGVYIPVT